jgi:hypothetical protein
MMMRSNDVCDSWKMCVVCLCSYLETRASTALDTGQLFNYLGKMKQKSLVSREKNDPQVNVF